MVVPQFAGRRFNPVRWVAAWEGLGCNFSMGDGHQQFPAIAGAAILVLAERWLPAIPTRTGSGFCRGS